ncbi:MAG: GNAT family N-acetyltransferase [Lachnospiraceae bacterium]|nr:GNAT family N-acetyltransferase [Lachnospiraceae bacterium]
MVEICVTKSETRKLYEETFDDPKEFVDYYYEDKCSDNTIIVNKINGEVISMVHLNPYILSVCKKTVKSYYLVAGATKKEMRGKGEQAKVMDLAFKLMKKEHIPFCYLLPVNEKRLTWEGFQKICSFSREKIDDYEKIKNDFDIYCVRNDLYIRRMEKEKAIDEVWGGEVLPPKPSIMAKIIDLQSFSEMAGGEFTCDVDALLWLKEKKIYICEEV